MRIENIKMHLGEIGWVGVDWIGLAQDRDKCRALVNVKKTPWPESANELYRTSDRRLSAKLVPTFGDRGCHVVSVTDPYGRILWFSRPACKYNNTINNKEQNKEILQ
jgi:hypothetical protein